MKKFLRSFFALLFICGNVSVLRAESTGSHYLNIKFPNDWKEQAFIKVMKSVKEKKIFYLFEFCEILPLGSKYSCKTLGKADGYLWHKVDGRLFPEEKALLKLESDYKAKSKELESLESKVSVLTEKHDKVKEAFWEKLKEQKSKEIKEQESWEFIKKWLTGAAGLGIGGIMPYLTNMGADGFSWKFTLITALSGVLGLDLGLSAYEVAIQETIDDSIFDEDVQKFCEESKKICDSYKVTKKDMQYAINEYEEIERDLKRFSPRYESQTKSLIVFHMDGDNYLEMIKDFE